MKKGSSTISRLETHPSAQVAKARAADQVAARAARRCAGNPEGVPALSQWPLGGREADQVGGDQRQLGVLGEHVLGAVEHLHPESTSSCTGPLAGAQEAMVPMTLAPESKSKVTRWLTMSRSFL